MALVIGVAVGFLVAKDVVKYVQTPLKSALKEHYGELDKQRYREYLIRERERGGPVPKDLEAAVKAFAEDGLVLDERMVNPREMADILNSIAPGAADPSKIPAASTGKAPGAHGLVPFHLYHSIDDDPRVRIVGFRMEEPFVVYMKAAFVVGATIASPFVFYFIWQFVAAGLYPHEQRYVRLFLPFSIGLFLAGAALAFFVVFRFVLAFLLSFYEWMGIDPDARISDWLTFVLIMPLGFGISFQLPLVMLFLERIGIFSVTNYLGNWRISVLVICFLAMILTPSDPYSMVLMAAPLIALFFFGILLCKWMPRRTTPFGELIE
jgi:sec-independent protein translocase protein TatC